MKINKLLLLGLIMLTSCNSTGHKPKYNNFKNDLDRENLEGKVLSLEKYKIIVSDSKTETTNNPTKELVMEFTETGNLSGMKKYDVFGKLIYSAQNIYNKKRLKIKGFTEDLNIDSRYSRSVEKYVYKNDKLSSAKIFVNDTLKYISYFEYDKSGHLTKQLGIQNNDTTLNKLTYIFDKHGNEISQKNIQTTRNKKYEYVNTYKFDNKNNIIETNSDFDVFGTSKNVNVYDSKNRIEKSTQYKDKLIEKDIIYDKFYDETLISFYRNGSLERELKYEYEFDKKGNWIKRKAYVKNCSTHSEEFKLAFIETRKIVYYE